MNWASTFIHFEDLTLSVILLLQTLREMYYYTNTVSKREVDKQCVGRSKMDKTGQNYLTLEFSQLKDLT